MSKFYEIQTNSIVSSYGGIGSLVETTTGSMIILPIEKWPYYIYEIDGKDRSTLDALSVSDPRLVQRLHSVFKILKFLLKVPFNATYQGGYRVKIETNLLSAEYFPKWMFCPNCLRFMKFEDWQRRYNIARLGKEFDLHCPDCQTPRSGKKTMRILLEQVRFIRISDEGLIEDFPWDEWFEKRANDRSNCDKHEFYYETSPYSDNLESIKITCKKCKSWVSLSGIFNDFYSESSMRTVLKSSNSVYFPAIVRSLMIPLLQDSSIVETISEMDYRSQELAYMICKSRDEDFDDCDQISLKSLPSLFPGVSLISVRSLSMSSVLCSYSRLQPISPGSVYVQNKSQHVTLAGLDTRFLPCVESSGEGFLLVFDDDVLSRWYSTALDNPEFLGKVSSHIDKLSSFNPFGNTDVNQYVLCKYILLHTISHLLIKQFEYVCGYSASSLNERIYCSSRNDAGIMIYTVAGSEGSYGGIVNVTEKGDMRSLVIDALQKAMYCTNDPVCYNQTSVCFSCCLIPETSCESFNSFLDRSFVVDERFGVFNTLLM